MAQIQFKSNDTIKWREKYGNRSAGAKVIASDLVDNTTETPKTSFSCAIGTTNPTIGSNVGFANGDLVLLYQTRNGGDGGGKWQLNKIVSGMEISLPVFAYPAVVNFGGTAQMIKLKQWSSFNIPLGVTLIAQAWDQTIGGVYPILCNGTVTIAGNISLVGRGFYGGSGGTDGHAWSGEGSGQVSTEDDANPAGNGGGSEHVSSAGGGNATTMSGPEGSEGTLDGNSDLTVMVLGGGGGGTAENSSSGSGGNGGGVLIIIAKKIVITGTILAHGNGGNDGTRGGSGGAGGSILFKGINVSIGTNLVQANGGTQGAGTTGNSTNGSVGRIHVDYAGALVGTSTPTLTSTKDKKLLPVSAGASLLIKQR